MTGASSLSVSVLTITLRVTLLRVQTFDGVQPPRSIALSFLDTFKALITLIKVRISEGCQNIITQNAWVRCLLPVCPVLHEKQVSRFTDVKLPLVDQRFTQFRQIINYFCSCFKVSYIFQ